MALSTNMSSSAFSFHDAFFIKTDSFARHPLSVLIEYFTWQTLVIITDGSMPAGVDGNFYTRQLQIHSLEDSSSTSLESILNMYSHPHERQHVFFVLCSPSTTMGLLDVINDHENHYQEQGVFTYLHRWLIFLENQSDLGRVQNHLVNITHLSALILQEPLSTCQLYAAMWTPEGRLFQTSALIDEGKIKGQIFPTEEYGLNGRRFVVTTNIWDPFVRKTVDGNGSVKYSGICFEILEALATVMNFTYTTVEPHDGQWGVKVNGEWTGIIGQIYNKTADILVAPSAIQVAREEAVDFTFTFYIEETSFIYKKEPSSTNKAVQFLRPYKWQVWACTTGLVLAVTLLLWALMQVVRRTSWTKTDEDLSLADAGWVVFSGSMRQALCKIPTHSALRSILGSWLFVFVIFLATYSSNLVALLSVEVERRPFNSLEELVAQDQYRFGFQGGTAYVSVFENASGVYGDVWAKVTKWKEEGYPVLHSNQAEQLKMVDAGGYAYFNDDTSLRIHSSTSCDLKLIREGLFPLHYGFGFQNNSAYVPWASKIILQMSQTGLISKWSKMYLPTTKSCSDSSSGGGTSINLEDVIGVFYMGVVMLGLAAVVLLMERHIMLYRKTSLGGQEESSWRNG